MVLKANQWQKVNGGINNVEKHWSKLFTCSRFASEKCDFARNKKKPFKVNDHQLRTKNIFRILWVIFAFVIKNKSND